MPGMELMAASKGSGCGCKINPAQLKELLEDVVIREAFPGLLVGNSMADDCSVYDLGQGLCLLQTVDFFTPIVNDAYVFGAAAAANALSDIWAMGGKPLMANAVFSWPLDKFPIAEGKKVLQGAADVCRRAGVPMAGGHSIDGQEVLFGLSVTGTCQQKNLKKNDGAVSGDVIILTRPLGVGMLAAAHKRGQASEAQNQALFSALQELNSIGAELAALEGVHAMTDVTGFGLAGHLMEICRASGAGAILEAASLPHIPEAEPLAAAFVLPDNAMRNWNALEKEVKLNQPAAFPWLVDPQTNGGLLLAVAPDCVEAALGISGSAACIIGRFTDGPSGVLVQ